METRVAASHSGVHDWHLVKHCMSRVVDNGIDDIDETQRGRILAREGNSLLVIARLAMFVRDSDRDTCHDQG